MMATISERAGVLVKYTNHSLRATAATRMFASGDPVGEVTGHKSLKALRIFVSMSEQVKHRHVQLVELFLTEVCLCAMRWSRVRVQDL